MVDPQSEESLDRFEAAAKSVSKSIHTMVAKRVKRARKFRRHELDALQMEMTAQFVHFRAIAEKLEPVVVNDGNEEFLRELVDELKEGITLP